MFVSGHSYARGSSLKNKSIITMVKTKSSRANCRPNWGCFGKRKGMKHLEPATMYKKVVKKGIKEVALCCHCCIYLDGKKA